ncbi:amidase [Actinomycetospora sp. C-140]
MPVTPPTPEELAALAERDRLGLDAAALAAYGPLVAGSLGAYDRVEQLWADHAPAAPDRPWSWPAEGENRWGAWYVRCRVEGAAEGPLAGRTMAVKDNTAVAGVPMANGSHLVDGFVPARDATVVTRLLDAGATVTGKSVCEDLCFSGSSHTSVSGPVRNPWDPTRITGGSSSGSAALLAAGEVDVATGGDQGGSVRMPAAMSGIVGHKPTYGLVPYTGAFPIEATIDHLGPMTRTVSDAALCLGIMAGPDGHDPRQPDVIEPVDYLAGIGRGAEGLRVGVVTEGFGHAGLSQPGVDASVRAAVDVLAGAGLAVEEVSVPWHRDALAVWSVVATDGVVAQMIEGNGYGLNWDGLYDPELIAHYGRLRAERGHLFSDTVKMIAMAGRHTLAREHGRHYAMARNLVPAARAGYDAALAQYDVLVMPTVPIVPSTIIADDAPVEESVARALEMIVNTAPTDVTGHPATSVPASPVDGLPVGMMIVGRHFDDLTCLRVARHFEQAVGGFPAPPVAAGAVAAG